MRKCMDKELRLLVTLSALAGLIAVAMGAFGAHGLQATATAVDLEAFKTGALYNLTHAIAALAAASLAIHGQKWATKSAWLFLGGVVLFSGSLYFLGLTGSRSLVIITPIGGTLFLGGWGVLAAGAYFHNSKNGAD